MKKEENRNPIVFFVILCLNHQMFILKVFEGLVQNAVEHVFYSVL